MIIFDARRAKTVTLRGAERRQTLTRRAILGGAVLKG